MNDGCDGMRYGRLPELVPAFDGCGWSLLEAAAVSEAGLAAVVVAAFVVVVDVEFVAVDGGPRNTVLLLVSGSSNG